MEIKVKHINVKSGGPQIVILNHKDALKLDVKEKDRIELIKGKNKTTAVLDIAYNTHIKKGEIGIYQEVVEKLKTKNSQKVKIQPSQKPQSIEYIKEKLDNKTLNKEKIDTIIKDLINNKLSEVESAYFVSACYTHGMTLEESAYLSQAIVKNGKTIKFNKKIVVDKHCIGGIPGNRTTMVVIPIIAAAGLTIPKTSTRSITSPAGTSDTMEVLAPVEHSKEKIKQIVKKTNGCMVWGGTKDLASADDLLIRLEKPMNLDPEGFVLASILAKKSAVDSSHVLIDIPIGPQAKVKNKRKAKILKNKFIQLGKLLHLKIKVIITKGLEPIGNGIGPALEARDVLLTLQNKGPKDLEQKSIHLASLIMNMAGIKFAKSKAKKILKSGKAYEKMQEIIKAQGGKEIKPENIKIGPHKRTIKAQKKGRITHIEIKEIAKIAKMLGAPADKEAGIYMNVKLKNKVKKNQTLLTMYAKHNYKLKQAIKEYKKDTISIST